MAPDRPYVHLLSTGYKMIIMKTLKSLLFTAIIFWSMSAYSEDCLVTTDARSLMTGLVTLQEEKLSLEEGRYSAIMKNGDVILARYASCDLGMQASYLSVKPLADAELMQLLEIFLARVLVSDEVVKKVLPQLRSLSLAALQKSVILQGTNDKHQIVVKTAASPNFHTIIQYNWISPEH